MRKFFSLLAIGVALLWATPTLATVAATRVGDAAYTITPTDTIVVTTTTLTAGRTWTLPPAASSCIGQSVACGTILQIIDIAGGISSSAQLTLAPASGETINGNSANLILSAAGTQLILYPTSGGNWYAVIEGDYNVATVATGSAVSLTTNTAADIVTLSLSQGVYDCRGLIARNVGGTTSFTKLSGSIGTTTNTLVAEGTLAATYYSTAANVIATPTDTVVGPVRVVLAATTTLRLVAQDTFTVSTDAAYGQLACTRVR